MVAELLSGDLQGLDEAALLGLARMADRLLAAPEGYRPGPWRSDRRAGLGQEFLDFQPHAPGGDARRVDWRASARSRVPLERRHRDATAGEWWVCLDRSASLGAPGDVARRLSVQLAAAFAYLLLHREHEVGFVGFGEDVDGRCVPGRGRAQFARVLRALARESRRGGGSRLEACVSQVSRRQSVVVVSDFLAPDAMRGGLERLLRRGGHVHALQVCTDTPVGDAGAGPALLRDAESGETLGVTDLDQAAGVAHDVLSGQRRALADFCRRHRIAHSVCRPGEGWRDVLLRHLDRARRLDA